MIAKDQIIGVVLAGGKSSRFGSNKALHQYEGITLLERTILLLTPFCQRIFISGQCESYKSFNKICIPDQINDIGPLGGIYSAMTTINSPYYLFMSCDMPFMSSDCIKKLLSLNHDAQITYWIDSEGNLQLLPLLISKSLLKAVINKVNHQSYNIRSLLDLSINQSFDISRKEQICFSNINYLSDIIC